MGSAGVSFLGGLLFIVYRYKEPQMVVGGKDEVLSMMAIKLQDG